MFWCVLISSLEGRFVFSESEIKIGILRRIRIITSKIIYQFINICELFYQKLDPKNVSKYVLKRVFIQYRINVQCTVYTVQHRAGNLKEFR